MDIVLASNNKGKIKEIKEILSEYNILSLSEMNVNIEVIEDQNSFYENAFKKAKEIYEVIKKPVIADDSGLCIDALNGFPGINTRRFLGEYATDKERNIALLEKLKNVKKRSAKVVCAIVYYDGVNIFKAEASLEGTITLEEKGENGFGFDSIFELPEGKTLAELTEKEKNEVSVRYLALKEIKMKLQK